MVRAMGSRRGSNLPNDTRRPNLDQRSGWFRRHVDWAFLALHGDRYRDVDGVVGWSRMVVGRSVQQSCETARLGKYCGCGAYVRMVDLAVGHAALCFATADVATPGRRRGHSSLRLQCLSAHLSSTHPRTNKVNSVPMVIATASGTRSTAVATPIPAVR